MDSAFLSDSSLLVSVGRPLKEESFTLLESYLTLQQSKVR